MQQQQQKISTGQAIFLLVNTITPTAILVVPTIALEAAAQDAWMSIVVATVFGIGLAFLYGSVCRHNPGVPFLTLVENKLGRIVSVITGLLLAQYYLSTTAVALREFVDFLSDELMERTPVIVLASVSLVVALYAVSEGIEVIARISAIVLVGSLIFLTLGIGMEFNLYHPKFMLPVGEASIQEIIRGGFHPFSWLSEAAILLLLCPYLVKPGHSRRIGIIGISIAGGELLLMVLLVLMSFGPELPKMLKYPPFAIAEAIKYGTFVERVDLMFVCVWMTTVFVKLCIFLFGTVHCFIHVFRIRAEKPFQLVIGVLVLLTALYSWSSYSLFNLHQQYVSLPYLILINILLPIALWIGFQLRWGKKSGTEGT